MQGKSADRPLKTRLSNAYGHFAETTTFGGTIHAWISPRWPWRLSWVVVVMILIGATIWNTREVVIDYLKWPVVTTVQVADQQGIPFPSVTVCNRNPIDCSKLAYAYVKRQDDLNNLMYLSQCHLTLAYDPLRSKLVSYGR
jgi:hypothetical protein